MQIEKLQLNLRRRTPWEAIDLGLAVLKHWAKPTYRLWFLTFIPFSLVTTVLLWQYPIAAMFIIWWLKPLFDRLLLSVYSTAILGSVPEPPLSLGQIAKILKGTNLFIDLTLRRFNPYRSFNLPITQLERLSGSLAGKRRVLLAHKCSGHALWLMTCCIHFVLIFEFAAVDIVGFLAPGDLPGFAWFTLFSDETKLWQSYLANAAWLLAETIVEPFYVAAGFTLYLNRRSELEGWDIEVAFKQMALRHAVARSMHEPEA